MATAFKNKSTEELTSARDKLDADIVGFTAKLDAAGTKGSMASKKADVGSQLEAHSSLRDKIQKELDAREFEAPSEPQRPAHERLDPSRQWMGLEDPKMAPKPPAPEPSVVTKGGMGEPEGGFEGVPGGLKLAAEIGASVLSPAADIAINTHYITKGIEQKDVVMAAMGGLGLLLAAHPATRAGSKVFKAIKAGDRSADVLRAAESILVDPNITRIVRRQAAIKDLAHAGDSLPPVAPLDPKKLPFLTLRGIKTYGKTDMHPYSPHEFPEAGPPTKVGVHNQVRGGKEVQVMDYVHSTGIAAPFDNSFNLTHAIVDLNRGGLNEDGGRILAKTLVQAADSQMYKAIAVRIGPHIENTRVHAVNKWGQVAMPDGTWVAVADSPLADMFKQVLEQAEKGGFKGLHSPRRAGLDVGIRGSKDYEKILGELAFVLRGVPVETLTESADFALKHHFQRSLPTASPLKAWKPTPPHAPGTDIFLKVDHSGGHGGIAAQTILHELLHAATVSQIVDGFLPANAGSRMAETTTKLVDLQNRVRLSLEYLAANPQIPSSKASHFRALLDEGIWLKNTEAGGEEAVQVISEFITYGLTSNFSELLFALPAKGHTAISAGASPVSTTALGEFVEIVFEALGLEDLWKAFTDGRLTAVDRTALMELLNLTDELLEAPVTGLQQAKWTRGGAARGTYWEPETTPTAPKRRGPYPQEPWYARPGVKVAQPAKTAAREVSRWGDMTPAEQKGWLGDSKVVDKAGEPLPAYHGTQAKDITEFKPEFVGSAHLPGGSPDTRVGEAYFFSSEVSQAVFVGGTTPEMEAAQMVMNEAPRKGNREARLAAARAYRDAQHVDTNVIETRLRMENPLVWDEDPYNEDTMAALITHAKKMGNDGVIWKSETSIGDTYVVFDPSQIKIVGSSVH